MRRTRALWSLVWIVLLASAAMAAGPASAGSRRVVDLGGIWQIAEGTMDHVPTAFEHRVPVPGLADLADPPFESPGSSVSLDDRLSPWLRPPDPRREAFWYRRTFAVEGPVPAVALLKVHKAKYGTKVFLNSRPVSEHLPCFTPGYFDLAPHLKGDGNPNELTIRVGASLASLPLDVLDGWDNEKARYIPGIYDRVELILSGSPHVAGVQTVPLVAAGAVTVVAEVANVGAEAANVSLHCVVREAKSGAERGRATSDFQEIGPQGPATFDVTIPIQDCRLWSPEDPFLYTVEVGTGSDTSTTRFGMRSFSTDPQGGRVLLNGKHYFLRGSNVCIFRFLEDAQRGGLPWDDQWVRTLHRSFKDMHWNSLRYCIGFPPERWYEIADEEGILIQDEFPIWYSRAKDGWPESITAEDVAGQYTEWMRQRWNHPCVVIWDAQNETRNDAVTAAAIRAVRGLDLSNRPWDNGWGSPQSPSDVTEWHPYRANRAMRKNTAFSLAIFAGQSGVPDIGPREGAHPPYIINEYGWLWMNRDGSLPTLTAGIYKNTLGENATVDQCRRFYARALAAMTEFWRAKRECAGVLHFCGLGYSRPDGQTSDNFIDVEALKYDPYFYQYVRDAFSPVGVMVDFWEETLPLNAGKPDVPVIVINDLDRPWRGTLTLKLVGDERPIWQSSTSVTLEPYGQQESSFAVDLPEKTGRYQLIAELDKVDGHIVRSLRDFTIDEANLALGASVTASTEVTAGGQTYPARLAVDGDRATRWSSAFSDPQWIMVDLGEPTAIGRVKLDWENAAARAYAIQVSDKGEDWTTVYETTNGDGGVDAIRFEPVRARYLRIYATRRTGRFGYSLYEIGIYQGRRAEGGAR